MRWFVRRLRPSPSMAVAFVALLVALGGTSYAAVRLAANSVGTRQLRSGAVHSADIYRNAVDSSKVKDGSLTGADVNEGSLAQVASAAAAVNATNATRAATSAGLDRVIYRAVAGSVPAGSAASPGAGGATATCDPGTHVVGGGVKVEDPESTSVTDAYPDGGGRAWTGRVSSDAPTPLPFTVFAICLPSATTG